MKEIKSFVKNNTKESLLFVVCVLGFILMSVLSPKAFLGAANLSSIMSQMPEFGIMALAMMIVVLTGGINLSLTYVASLSGISMAIVMSKLNENGEPAAQCILLAVLAGILIAVVCGLINGFLVAYIHVAPILATLGTQILFEGVGQNITRGSAISGFPEVFSKIGEIKIIGIPIPMMIFIGLAIITYFVYEKSPWGVRLHMLGSNIKAVEYSGINTKKMIIQVYIISGVVCWFASFVMMARYNSMKVDYGSSYMLQSILAVVMGGTSIAGGYGKVGGTILAVLTLQIISSGLNIFGLNRFFTDIIMGLLLILVLSLNYFYSQFSNKRLIEKEKN